MTDQEFNLSKISLERGFGPNEVAIAARGFLTAAELMNNQLEVDAKNWLIVPAWHVLHHLCAISAELFVKSLVVEVTYSQEGDESGPYYESTNHSYSTHHYQLDKLTKDDRIKLLQHLTDDQREMLEKLSNSKSARINFARGRYPYDLSGDYEGFPGGECGRVLAHQWLDLARSLASFCA